MGETNQTERNMLSHRGVDGVMVSIQSSILDDYVDRDVLPDLRRDAPSVWYVEKKTERVVFRLSCDQAAEVYRDACRQRLGSGSRSENRKLRAAYSGLSHAVADRCASMWMGRFSMVTKSKPTEAAAAFWCDDEALLWGEVPVRVTANYGVHDVTQDGETVARWGYLAKVDGVQYFAPPWQLKRMDGTPGHLCIVPMAR